jgi:ATP-dependent Clp protease ATP-binding subunit ClpC
MSSGAQPDGVPPLISVFDGPEGNGEAEGEVFERYTEPARRVIFYSRLEAVEHGARRISSEHLLAALLRCQARPLVLSLAECGLTVQNVQQVLEQFLPPRVQPQKGLDVPLDSGAMRVLELAAEESSIRKDAHLGTEHLLLGLMREPEGLAGTILLKVGFTVATVRDVIEKLRVNAKADHPRGENR